MAGAPGSGGGHTAKDWVCVGALAGAHGVRGEVRLKPFTEDPAAVADFHRLHLGPGGKVIAITIVKPIKEGFAVQIPGIDNREAAEALKGERLYVARGDLPEPDEPDEFYVVDLIGLEARDDRTGARIGEVQRVADFGAGNLIELWLDTPLKGWGRSVMIPFVQGFVPVVDPADGFVTIRLDAWLKSQSESGVEHIGKSRS